MDWKSYFNPIILERGREYFYEDLVEVTYIDKREIDTIVYGTEEYKVEIEKIGTQQMTMICDCPHAMDDNYCKHMAASLFMFEDLQGTIKKKQSRRKIDNDKLLSKLAEADSTTVKAWVYEICSNDVTLYDKFINDIEMMERIEEERINKPKLLQTYKKDIREIYKGYERGGLIDYTNAIALFRELIDYVEEEVEKLQNYPERAIKLMNYTVMQFEEYTIDDSAGIYGELLNCVYRLSTEIIEKADEKSQGDLFNIYGNVLSEYNGIACGLFEEIFYENFNREEQLILKVQLLESFVLDDNITIYDKEVILKRLIKTYVKQGYSKEDIVRKVTRYRQFDTAKEYLILYHLDKGEVERAIKMIKEGTQSPYPGIAEQYRELLIEVYRNTGHAEYLQELYNYLSNSKWTKINYYNELKAAYTDKEWQQIREYLYRSYEGNPEVIYYYAEDGLYDRILEGIEESQFHFGWFKELKDNLLAYDKERTLRIYERFVNSMAMEANNRKQYNKVMTYLKNIKEIQGNLPIAERIASQWRILFKKRTAMMDELEKVMG